MSLPFSASRFTYLATCIVLIFSFALHVRASPTTPEAQALARRQRGTYSGNDDDGTGHAGSYHCFRGGSWYKQSDIAGLWDQACSNTTTITYDFQHFSYTPKADGSFPEESVKHTIYTSCLENSPAQVVCQDTGFEVTFSATFESGIHANQTECEWAMKRVSDLCHGDHQDSRGGWFEFDDDGSTYGFDPQSDIHGKEQK